MQALELILAHLWCVLLAMSTLRAAGKLMRKMWGSGTSLMGPWSLVTMVRSLVTMVRHQLTSLGVAFHS